MQRFLYNFTARHVPGIHEKTLISAVLLVFMATLVSLRAAPLTPAELMGRLDREIQAGLVKRDVAEQFGRYQAYATGRMDASAGSKRWSDKTGNCRLSYVDWMMRNQLKAPASAEQFTRELHQALSSGQTGLMRALDLLAAKVDLQPAAPVTFHGDTALATVSNVLTTATHLCSDALAPLSEKQLALLREKLYLLTTGGKNSLGAVWQGGKQARAVADALEQLDRQAYHQAAAVLSTLNDPDVLLQFKQLAAVGSIDYAGVEGALAAVQSTPDGVILVGGTGTNTYQLDTLTNVVAVIDVGGNDVYLEGSVTAQRPVLIVIDLAGDDIYRGQTPGIQGGAILGASLLIDVEGNDAYDAQDIAQGSCLAGVGLLFDLAGDDSYRALRRAQGQAICGPGLLLDSGGNDSYHAALWSQGVGSTLGIGVLDDLAGEDHYYAGGLYPNCYGDSPGYAGWSQGVGIGPRGTANGGIGVLLDGAGDDTYECDYFSHGGGYWFAAGFARDFGGNDKRLGSTRLGYDGLPRGERIFLRWGIAYGCHYGAGFVFDDSGDDTYGGNVVGLGFAWDIAVGALCDFGGNDHYTKIGSGQGVARQASLAILYNTGGDDVYEGTGQAMANPVVTYHPMPACGGNFSFLVDYLGQDTYGGITSNNCELVRQSPTGFLIDRAFVPSAH